jgi:hypothetical protein
VTTTSLTDRQQIPDLGRPVVDLVERFGFQWEFDYEYPLPETGHRLQIRKDEHVAPGSMVSLIRAAMRRGDSFPPIVVTQDGYIVDGNTRVTAAGRNSFPKIQAIILDVEYEKATESENRRLWSLGAAFNARHGKGIDREELRNAVWQIGADPSYTATRIASLIGVTESTVQSLLAEKKARDRADNLGLHLNGSVASSKLRTLGRQSEYLNDEPFRELITLVQDSGMSEPEIRTIVQKAKDTKSDEGALGVIAHEKQARREQIAEYKASGKSVPPAAAKLRQRLGFILAYSGNAKDLVERNPGLAKEHIDMMERSIVVLQGAIAAQQR